MNACLAMPLFGQIFPPSMLYVVADYFDLVAPVHEFQPSQVAGVISTSPIWKFGDRINIIVGPSGSGNERTRILGAMKRQMTELAPVNLKVAAQDNMSQGQRIFTALETLLQIPTTKHLPNDRRRREHARSGASAAVVQPTR